MARSETTLEDLARYLAESGIVTQTLGTASAGRVERTSCAVVLFPDDFEGPRAEQFVRSLRRARPRVLVIVVTREPHRLGPVLDPDERSLAPVVLPRPSFGWSIVDVIRAHRQSELA